jgi:hypothetical protein
MNGQLDRVMNWVTGVLLVVATAGPVAFQVMPVWGRSRSD